MRRLLVDDNSVSYPVHWSTIFPPLWDYILDLKCSKKHEVEVRDGLVRFPHWCYTERFTNITPGVYDPGRIILLTRVTQYFTIFWGHRVRNRKSLTPLKRYRHLTGPEVTDTTIKILSLCVEILVKVRYSDWYTWRTTIWVRKQSENDYDFLWVLGRR